MSGSFQSVRLNACEHRPDLGLYSYPKKLYGNEVRKHVSFKGKSLLKAQTRFKPAMLYHAGQ